MLNTTFAKLHEHGACPEGYQKLARSLGGINKYGKDTLIPLDKIIESNGLQDTIWTLRATTESAENLLVEFACRCAEHVLHFYEDKYPDDKRPRRAIETTLVCITDKSPEARAAARAARDAAWNAARAAWDARDAAWAAARDAAWNAAWAGDAAWNAAWDARDAAWAAARDAAWNAARAAAEDAAGDAAWNAARAAAEDAAGDIEEKWQIEQFLELLNK